ncbi:uncharacterized protein A1O5_09608 [Cladophialophora psammophila CBS 110553]|uniref:Transcription factor domain-containing protein n=1 Tax=Cladophialophora psammophila CBS 110553 TaxID=1182543 RepID=W9WFS5_9EURO|nr:uncharacterized protein A1O5_09608 [Cladophialophora psammophila CBS 110553]EXJ66962.1 hypothetical protein A1O5_09608 [Cladophialophora psammophila CBS 110553]
MGPAERTKTPFIFTDGSGKAEPAMRKLIRKYVMLGKNRGKTRNLNTNKMKNPYYSEKSNGYHDGPSSLLIKMRYSMIPNKVGSELSFTQFAAAVEPPLLHDLLKFSFMAKRIMYPLERYIVFHRKTNVDTSWFELLTFDAAYLHAAVFASQAYISLISTGENPAAARQAIVHHSAALRLLRERLSISNRESKVSDSTVLVVLYLALHAHFMIDYNTAKHHMEGLRNIVDMRGGLFSFSYNTKLIIELLKCDLGIALNNGTKPTFFNDRPSEPLMPYILPTLAAEEPDHATTRRYWKPVQLGISIDLVQAWTFLKRFCSTINSAAEHKRQLPKETLLKAMAALMYRLIWMNSFDPTSLDEAVRLSLLAFSSNIFLDWQNVKPSHAYLRHTYQNCLLNLSLPSALSPQFLLWMLMIGSLSTFNPADAAWLMPWMRVTIELCEAHTWSQLHRQLKAFPWIDVLHDKPARAMFDAALSSQTSAGRASPG